MELYLNEELVFRNVQAKTDSEVLAFLASEMYKKNYVKEEYIQAIQEREKEYPTGLPSTPPGIAIPHANYEMVNKTTLAIANHMGKLKCYKKLLESYKMSHCGKK